MGQATERETPMSEPSSSVPGEIADAEVERADNDPADGPDGPEQVELHLDEEKIEAWEAVAGDYEVEPHGEPVPNSMTAVDFEPVRDDEDDEDGGSDQGDAGSDQGDGVGDGSGAAGD
jgi:hypothetical protein